jgi:cell division protein ZapA
MKIDARWNPAYVPA